MPIRPENRDLYPDNWKEISDEVRFGRAKGRCECTGQCGTGHVGRCYGQHNQAHPVTFAMVVLTTMHLDHDPTNNGTPYNRPNLLAGCQQCHNAYDADHRKEGIKRRAREEMEANGQGILFETEKRDAILDAHERNKANDLTVVRRELRELYAKREMVRDDLRHTGGPPTQAVYVSANDFGPILKAEGIPRGNWLGSVFRPHEWIATGQTIKSTTKGRNASRILTWRLAA